MKYMLTAKEITEITGVSDITLGKHYTPKFRYRDLTEKKPGRPLRIYLLDIEELTKLNDISLRSYRGTLVTSVRLKDPSKYTYFSLDTNQAYRLDPNGPYTEYEGKIWLVRYNLGNGVWKCIDPKNELNVREFEVTHRYSKFNGWELTPESKYQGIEYKSEVTERASERRNAYNARKVTCKDIYELEFLDQKLLDALRAFKSSNAESATYKLDGYSMSVTFSKE